MNNLKIPAWLVSIVGMVFVGIVLERLYVAKVPVKIWGIELNQPDTRSSDKPFNPVLTKAVGCHNTCNKDLGSIKDRFCFLAKVKGAFNGGAESAEVKPDGSSWRLITSSGGSQTWAVARCIKY